MILARADLNSLVRNYYAARALRVVTALLGSLVMYRSVRACVVGVSSFGGSRFGSDCGIARFNGDVVIRTRACGSMADYVAARVSFTIAALLGFHGYVIDLCA